MRIGIPAFLAARTTCSTLSGPPMFPGLIRTAATPAVDRLERERGVEVDVRDHGERRQAHDERERRSVLVLRDGHAHDLAARRRERRDLRRRRRDVVRLRERHRLHDDGRPAADRDVADPDLDLARHA